MKRLFSSLKSKITIIPVVMFFSLYAILHIFLIDNINTYSVYTDIAISLLAGFALGLVNICIITRRKSGYFWYECAAFWIVFILVQIISAILFYGYYRSDITQNSVWYIVLYYFPQMIIVLFTVPGAILYHLMGFIAARWLHAKQNA